MIKKPRFRCVCLVDALQVLPLIAAVNRDCYAFVPSVFAGVIPAYFWIVK